MLKMEQYFDMKLSKRICNYGRRVVHTPIPYLFMRKRSSMIAKTTKEYFQNYSIRRNLTIHIMLQKYPWVQIYFFAMYSIKDFSCLWIDSATQICSIISSKIWKQPSVKTFNVLIYHFLKLLFRVFVLHRKFYYSTLNLNDNWCNQFKAWLV